MPTSIKCDNCGKVIGEKSRDISEIQVVSCGNSDCNKVVFKMARKIFIKHQEKNV